MECSCWGSGTISCGPAAGETPWLRKRTEKGGKETQAKGKQEGQEELCLEKMWLTRGPRKYIGEKTQDRIK